MGLDPERELRRLADEAQRQAREYEKRAVTAEKLLAQTAARLDALLAMLAGKRIISGAEHDAIRGRR